MTVNGTNATVLQCAHATHMTVVHSNRMSVTRCVVQCCNMVVHRNRRSVTRCVVQCCNMVVHRNRLSLTGNHALYLIINKRTIASMTETIGRLYQTEQDEDGFLYVTYTSQEAFGSSQPPLPPV